jgi:D-alanyl-D-alanine-carboxypeptidase/D-alanyl-D-alanine-endopeptidase
LLEPYAGRYQFINNIVIQITKEKDRLFAQATGQGKLELFPVSATEFDLRSGFSLQKIFLK